MKLYGTSKCQSLCTDSFAFVHPVSALLTIIFDESVTDKIFFLHFHENIQSIFDGLNIFGTMEICSRHRQFEPLRLIIVPGQEENWDNLRMFFRSSIK